MPAPGLDDPVEVPLEDSDPEDGPHALEEIAEETEAVSAKDAVASTIFRSGYAWCRLEPFVHHGAVGRVQVFPQDQPAAQQKVTVVFVSGGKESDQTELRCLNTRLPPPLSKAQTSKIL